MAARSAPSHTFALRRAAASGIDALLALLLTWVLSPTLGVFFAERAVVTLHIGEPGTWWQGPLPMVLGAFGEIVYGYPCAAFVVWLLDPLTGATVGKRALGLRVRAVDGGVPAVRQIWTRTLLLSVGFWGWTLALVTGRWEVAIGATAAGAIVLVGAALALVTGGCALHDRVAATAVCAWNTPAP